MGLRQGQRVEIIGTGEKGRVFGPHDSAGFMYVLIMDNDEQRVLGRFYLKMLPDVTHKRLAYVEQYDAPEGVKLDVDSYQAGVMDERGRILEAFDEVYKHAPEEELAVLETMREWIERG